jgi:lysophospholipase L1-like esterase
LGSLRRTAAIAACLLVWSRPALADALAIIVGDSIVQTYPDDWSWPIQGWGADMRKHFGPDIVWFNNARGGMGTRRFVEEGWWDQTLALAPQFIVIQLGIADSWGDYATDPNTTYRANLHQMIVDAREIGAEPILVTPTAIRYVAPDGIHVARPSALEPWASAMAAQAEADGVALIDMHNWSLDLYDSLGMPLAQELYGFIIPGGGDPPIPPGTPDTIHFSPFGADEAATMVASRIPLVSPNLAAYLLPTGDPPPPPATASVFPYEETCR